MFLYEAYRPKTWAEVIGQDKVLAKIEALRPRGLAGRAYWISGASGTGKTTIALLLTDKTTAYGRATLGAKPFRRAPK